MPAGATPNWFDSLVVRYSANGALDTSFGTNGAAITRVGGNLGGEEETYTAVGFQPDGKVVAAGYYATSVIPNTGSFTLGLDVVRYIGDSSAPATTRSPSPLASTPSSPTPDSLLIPLALDDLDLWKPLGLKKPSRSF